MVQPTLLLDWIDRALGAVSVERRRATRCAEVAARHERLAVTGVPALRPFHSRTASANRELEARHHVAAGIHAAHVARLRASVQSVMLAPPSEPEPRSPGRPPAWSDLPANSDADRRRDAVTGLPNRRLLAERLAIATAVGDPQPHGIDLRLAVCLIGLDNLQSVIDRFGREIGDRLLVAVTRRLTDRIPGRFLARFAEDEFVVLLENMNSWEEAPALAELVIATISQPLTINGHHLAVTASIGVAQRQVTAADPGELLRDADTSLGWARGHGRGQVAVFDRQRNEEATAHSALAADLPAAIEAGDIVAMYQPIVALTNGHVVGVEALVRWRHPERGLLLPDQFLDLAEQAGMMRHLGQSVLVQACTEAARWGRNTSDPPFVSVNIAAEQLQDFEIVREVASVLARTGLPASRLALEITEGSIVQPGERSLATLDRLVSLGVSIAIDDFGTGYSNLSYLRRLPVSTLKIDRAFITDLMPAGEAPDESGTGIMVAIISLAHTLGLAVVAEGVETMSQAAWLKSMNVDSAQGWYFGRPADADHIETVIIADSQR